MALALGIVFLVVAPLLGFSVLAFRLKHKAKLHRERISRCSEEALVSSGRLQEVQVQTAEAQAILRGVFEDRPAAA